MTIGPLSYLVLAFPGNQFTGEIIPQLEQVVDRGLIDIIDLIFILKDQDGTVEGVELAAFDEVISGALAPLVADVRACCPTTMSRASAPIWRTTARPRCCCSNIAGRSTCKRRSSTPAAGSSTRDRYLKRTSKRRWPRSRRCRHAKSKEARYVSTAVTRRHGAPGGTDGGRRRHGDRRRRGGPPAPGGGGATGRGAADDSRSRRPRRRPSRPRRHHRRMPRHRRTQQRRRLPRSNHPPSRSWSGWPRCMGPASSPTRNTPRPSSASWLASRPRNEPRSRVASHARADARPAQGTPWSALRGSCVRVSVRRNRSIDSPCSVRHAAVVIAHTGTCAAFRSRSKPVRPVSVRVHSVGWVLPLRGWPTTPRRGFRFRSGWRRGRGR